jgi:hypothetical protein
VGTNWWTATGRPAGPPALLTPMRVTRAG